MIASGGSTVSRPHEGLNLPDYAMMLDACARIFTRGSAGVPDALRSLADRFHAVAPDSLAPDVEQRLQELAALDRDWSGSSEPVSGVAIAVARQLLAKYTLPQPGIFPTEEGGIRLEWMKGSRDISAVIHPDGGLYLHILDLRTRADHDAVEGSVGSAYSRLSKWLG